MKHLYDYILEQQSDATSQNILFDFTGIEHADETIKSLEEISKKSGVPVSVDGQKVTLSLTSTTLDSAAELIDALQKFINVEGKSQRRASDEQYAQKLHRFEDSMKQVDNFKSNCAEIADAEQDKAQDPEQDPDDNEPGAADGGKLDK